VISLQLTWRSAGACATVSFVSPSSLDIYSEPIPPRPLLWFFLPGGKDSRSGSYPQSRGGQVAVLYPNEAFPCHVMITAYSQ